jgi:RNA polymerase sigma factor (sigma-70 family)
MLHFLANRQSWFLNCCPGRHKTTPTIASDGKGMGIMKTKKCSGRVSSGTASRDPRALTDSHEETSPQNVVCDSPARSEDQELVDRCLGGDQEAWEILIDKYKKLIYSIPFRYGASPEDAADVFQAVCMEMFNSLAQLKNVELLRSWLITVTVRKAYRWKKKRPNHVELDAMQPDVSEGLVTAPETILQIQQEQIVREVVKKLPPRYAELVRLLFFEQPPLPYAEVAKRMGLAVGSISFLRCRCLEKLRKVLVESGFDGPVIRSKTQERSYRIV